MERLRRWQGIAGDCRVRTGGRGVVSGLLVDGLVGVAVASGMVRALSSGGTCRLGVVGVMGEVT